ncbi:MAG: GyrI-like domain-containing protein, partial [Anaerolineae bacterium]|nr:GyrI-like domain-containing protein [Anaerolineae bacterium]
MTEVRIVRLEPMQIASAHGFGTQPEMQAWEKIFVFVRGIDLKTRRFFGFNNPNPAPGSPNYGYEQWVTVPPEAQPEGEVEIKTFEGGLYAVTRCRLSSITEVWQQLVTWREDSPYKPAHHQWLEETLTSDIFQSGGAVEDALFDLYLP